MAIRLLLADHQPLLRAGLRLILGSQPGIEIVAECSGGSWLDPRVTPRVLGALRGRSVPAAAKAITRLTERESEVLRLMASGANNREIAGTLHVSERTVKSHVGAMFAKLGVRDRAGAIVVAFESGLGRGPVAATSRAS